MLNLMIRWSLQNRLWVVLGAVLVLTYGSLVLRELPIDVFPDLNKPTVTLLVEGHGRAPEEMETLITLPIENAVNGLPDLERITSNSGIGLSVITLQFAWGSDIYRHRQMVSEKLQLVRERLPADVQPLMAPVASLMGQIQQIAISAEDDSISPMELRTLAEWVIRPRLLGIPGVAQVISIGGGLRQYQILISSEKLSQRQISLDQVNSVLQKISQNTTGGFIDEGAKELLVRNIGAVTSVEEIENSVVGLHFGRPVLLKEIAKVQLGPKIKRGDGSFNGRPAVIMVIQKQPGTDTVQLTEKVGEVLQDLKPLLPPKVLVNPEVFQQAKFIQSSIDGILGKLKFGTVLVFVILFIFLANLRMSLITMTAIPLSFALSFLVFKWLGFTVNTMTLGGLAIAIGELVDDSIVDVENIFRRLRENAARANPLPRLKVIFEASSEVRNSIVLATFIILLVFLPLFGLDGLSGRLFAPLASAYLIALISSLIVSLTLVPVLSSFLLRGRALEKDHDKETWLVRHLKSWDRQMLDRTLDRPRLVLGATLGLLLASIALIPWMGRDFLPHFNEGTAMVAVFAKPGISLEESNRIGKLAEQKIMGIDGIKSVSRRTGRAEQDEHAMGVNVSEIDVDFEADSPRGREEVLHDVRQALTEIPDIAINVGQPISHLIDHTMSGVSAQVAIKVYGPELEGLRAKAAEIVRNLEGTAGLVDLRAESQTLIPELKIHILREEAAQFGLSSGEITELLEAALNGEVVSQVIEGQRFFDLFFRFDDQSRANLASIGEIILKTMPDGRRVRIKDVADIYETEGPNQVSREDLQRRIIISANVAGKDLGSVVTEIEKRLEPQRRWNDGYYFTIGGQFEAQQQATQRILFFGILSILGVGLLLFSHFRSVMITSQIMLTIPLAFIGGLIALMLTGQSLTVASLVGFITVCGIASRNSIMMISHYLHLMQFEGEKFSRSMIIRGSLERLTPVLMTASVAALALLPLALAKNHPGSEILYPVAVVTIGGLVSSTLLDLIVTPLVFWNFGRHAAELSIQPRKDEQI